MSKKEELHGILKAYREVHDASWPTMHPTLASRAARWVSVDEAGLEAELQSLVAETNKSDGAVRVFWKLGPDYVYGGCNDAFARDAGLPASQIVGINDFDRRLPWMRQSHKYRADDREVVSQGKAKLDILERQDSATGIIYLLTGKAPVLLPSGEAVGLLGIYEMIDEDRAAKIYAKQVSGR